MTYPPQQPYGGQPDPYNQGGQGQQPYGQQPPNTGGFNQPQDPYGQQQGGYPGGQQPGGYPGQQGGYPGQPGQPGQPGPYGYPPQGQPGPGGPQGPYGPPPGYEGYGTPPGGPKKRTGLIIGIVVAVVVLVGGGIGAYFLFSGSDPKAAAESFFRAYEKLDNSEDPTAEMTPADFEAFTCAADMAALRTEYDKVVERKKTQTRSTRTTSPRPKTTYKYVVKEVTGEGDTARKVKVGQETLTEGKEPKSKDRDVDMIMENGDWKVCGVFKTSSSSGGSSGGQTPTTTRPRPTFTLPSMPSLTMPTMPSLTFPLPTS